jgi:hypothetical protein
MRWREFRLLAVFTCLIVIGSLGSCSRYDALLSFYGEDSEKDAGDECELNFDDEPPALPTCSRPYEEPVFGDAELVYEGEVSQINGATMDYAVLVDPTVEGLQLLPADSRSVLPPIEGIIGGDFSSDGKYIAYNRLGGEEFGIFLHDLETWEIRQIGRSDVYDEVEFSPDASRLVHTTGLPSSNEMRELRISDLAVVHEVSNVDAAWYTRKRGHLVIRNYPPQYYTLLIATDGGEPRHIADDVYHMLLTPDESAVYVLHGCEEYCEYDGDCPDYPWCQYFGPHTLEVVPLTPGCPSTILATDAIGFSPTYSEGRVLVFAGRMSLCSYDPLPTELRLVEADGASRSIAEEVFEAGFLDGDAVDAVWYLRSDGQIRIHRLPDGAELAVGRGAIPRYEGVPIYPPEDQPDTPPRPPHFKLRAVPGTDLALILAVPADAPEEETAAPLVVVDLSTLDMTTMIDSALRFAIYEHDGRAALLLSTAYSAEDPTLTYKWADPWDAEPREIASDILTYQVHEYAEGLALYVVRGENRTLEVSFPAGEPLVPITDRLWYFVRPDSHPCDLLVYRYLEGQEWDPLRKRYDVLVADAFGRGVVEVAGDAALSTVLRDAGTGELVFVTGTPSPPDSDFRRVYRIRMDPR